MLARKRLIRSLLAPREPVQSLALPTEFVPPSAEEIDYLMRIHDSASYLIQVMGALSQTGPLFKIADENVTGEEANMLRHAILDLQSHIHGTEPPALALPEKVN